MARPRPSSGSLDEADTDCLDALDDLVEADAAAVRLREQAATEVACEPVPALATTRRTIRARSARRATGRVHASSRRRASPGRHPLSVLVGVVAVVAALGVVVALL